MTMPKGDAELLRADIDDGYAKISLLLLEMLSCAPLAASEYATVLFIIRRTYGWAKGADRNSGKLDQMTAREIATGTNQPQRTVEDALASLWRAHVIIKEQAKAGGPCAYGINSEVLSWGLQSPEWKSAKVMLRECRDRQIFSHHRAQNNQNPPQPDRTPEDEDCTGQDGHPPQPDRTPPTVEADPPHGGSGQSGAMNPTGTGADALLQRCRQGVLQRRGQDGTAPIAHSEHETPDDKRPTPTADDAVAAARAFYGSKQPPGGWKKYEQALREGLEIAGDRLPLARVIDAYQSDSPDRPQPGDWADGFLKRLMNAHEHDAPAEDRTAILNRGRLVRQISDAIEAGDDERVRILQQQLVASI